MNLKFLVSLEVMVNSVRHNVILAIDLAMVGKFIGTYLIHVIPCEEIGCGALKRQQ